MASIYLVRHGQDLDNASGILNGRRDRPLSTIGIGQARQLAERIRKAGLSFSRVLSSPLQRALATAELITASLQMNPPEVLEQLIERDFGIMSGKKAIEIESLCSPDVIRTATITYFLHPEGAESFPELLARAGKLLQSLTETYRDETLLLVTHGDMGKMLYAAFYHLSWQEVLTSFHFGNSELLVLERDRPVGERIMFKVEQWNF